MSPATRDPIRRSGSPTDAGESPGKHVVLILSSDAVAAALIGALVETLGYLVRFYHPPEDPEAALRRERPSVAMVDCDDPTMMREELFGHARMRGISVVMFGSPEALRRVRQLAEQHSLETVMLPAGIDALDETLRKAVSENC